MKRTIAALTFFLALVGINASAQDVRPGTQSASIDSCFTDCINIEGADLPRCLGQCLTSWEVQQSLSSTASATGCGRPANANRPFWDNIECLIDKKVREQFEKLANEKFANVILMTDRECETLGSGWRPYAKTGGRFPLAAGHSRDARGETITFELGAKGGEYRHQLSEQEMPEHAHRYRDRYNRGVRADYGDDEPTEHHNNWWRTTESMGGNQPHNNMPPYLVLNFCHYQP